MILCYSLSGCICHSLIIYDSPAFSFSLLFSPLFSLFSGKDPYTGNEEGSMIVRVTILICLIFVLGYGGIAFIKVRAVTTTSTIYVSILLSTYRHSIHACTNPYAHSLPH